MNTQETTGAGPILVYGATGAQGRPVADALLRSGYRVRGVSRSLAAGQSSDDYETAHVELADRGSIDAATAGSGGVFLHLPNIFDVELAMAFLRNAIEAARAAGVRRLVYTTSSGAPAEPTEIAMFEIRRAAQDYLAGSGLDVTIIRPTVYTDSLAQPYLWQAALEQGVWLWPYLPDHRVSWISARDQAQIVAAAFGRPGTIGATYDIGAPAVSGAEFAAVVSSVLDHQVAYVPVDPDAFEASLRGFIGPVAAKAVSDVYRWHREHGTEPVQVDDPGVAEREFGVHLTPLEADLRALAAASGVVRLAGTGALPAIALSGNWRAVAADVRWSLPLGGAWDGAAMTINLDRKLGSNLWPIKGRDAELELADRLLSQRDVRLLTLTGPGGVGKTRLAVELGRQMQAHFADGVYVLDLTRAAAGSEVPALIAQSLGLIARHDEPPLAAVLDELRNREMLLIFDNCEHLPDLATLLADLIADTAGVTVLATSRCPIGLSWEHRLTIVPLALPDSSQADPGLVGLASSVAVFVARAQAVDPTFELTERNAHDVAQLVERLDGLPLALELAAARIGLLNPAQMVTRLDHHLPLLGVASADRPGRHRSLQAAMDWSYELLDEDTRRLFRVCSVFAGSFSLHAAQEVAARQGGSDVLAVLAVLVDENLIRPVEHPDEPRFAMLQTIREYAGELLRAAGEDEQIAEEHARYFADIAMRAGPQLIRPDQEAWLRTLQADRDNLRLSFEWMLAREPVTAGRAAASVARMWWMNGQVREGYQWLEHALTVSENAPAADRLPMLWAAGELALWQGDVESGRHWHHEQLVLAQQVRDHESARWARLNLSVVSALSGELDAARRELRKLMDEVTRDDQAWLRALSLRDYSWFSGMAGDTAAAHRAGRTAADGFRRFGCVRDLAIMEISQADFARDAGRRDEAITLLRRSLLAGAQLNDRRIIGFAADVVCTVAADRGETLVRLLAAANDATAIAGMPIDARREEIRRTLAADLAAILGETAFADAWSEGSALAPSDTVATALSLLDTETASAVPGTAASGRMNASILSAREAEVLTLVAEGMPNKRIARTLGIAERTVKAHLTTAFQKLGAYSRGHAALVARERGLIGPRSPVS